MLGESPKHKARSPASRAKGAGGSSLESWFDVHAAGGPVIDEIFSLPSAGAVNILVYLEQQHRSLLDGMKDKKDQGLSKRVGLMAESIHQLTKVLAKSQPLQKLTVREVLGYTNKVVDLTENYGLSADYQSLVKDLLELNYQQGPGDSESEHSESSARS